MSKKHFIELADCLRDLKPQRPSDGAMLQWKDMIDGLADFCAAQNPRFNRERWLGYIAGENGPSGGAVKR